MGTTPISRFEDSIRVKLRVVPKAARSAVQGLITEADGSVSLKVSVTAAPEAGKANSALLKLLAKEWRVPRSALKIVLGANGRRKIVAVEGDPSTLETSLLDWLATVPK